MHPRSRGRAARIELRPHPAPLGRLVSGNLGPRITSRRARSFGVSRSRSRQASCSSRPCRSPLFSLLSKIARDAPRAASAKVESIASASPNFVWASGEIVSTQQRLAIQIGSERGRATSRRARADVPPARRRRGRGAGQPAHPPATSRCPPSPQGIPALAPACRPRGSRPRRSSPAVRCRPPRLGSVVRLPSLLAPASA